MVLRKTRSDQGVSIEEVALYLGLTPAAVGKLEADDYERLPAAVYVRGYIRRYCLLLQIDQEPLIAAYELLAAELETVRHKSARGKVSQSQAMRNHYQPDRRRLHLAMLIAVAAVVIAVVAAIGNWLYSAYSTAQTNAQFGAQAALTSDGAAGAAIAPQDGATTSSNLAIPLIPPGIEMAQMSPAGEVNELAEANEAADETNNGSVPSDAAGPAADELASAEIATVDVARILELTFARESWVKVVDARGEVLVMLQKNAGSQLTLNGRPPFSVVLGNAPGVQVKYRGQNIPIANINPQTNAARFVVGQ